MVVSTSLDGLGPTIVRVDSIPKNFPMWTIVRCQVLVLVGQVGWAYALTSERPVAVELDRTVESLFDEGHTVTRKNRAGLPDLPWPCLTENIGNEAVVANVFVSKLPSVGWTVLNEWGSSQRRSVKESFICKHSFVANSAPSFARQNQHTPTSTVSSTDFSCAARHSGTRN